MPGSPSSSAPSGLLVFAGKQVGLACLRYLVEAGYPVAYVVVAQATDEPLRAFVREMRLPHHVYESREHTAARLRGRHFAWLLNLWSAHILPPALLELADHRLNIHPGYAPHCLGSDSATWAIRQGVTAGVSLLEMEPGIDRGGLFAQRVATPVFPETGAALFARLKETAIALFRDEWPDIHAGRRPVRPQEGAGSYHTTKMTRADRCLDGACPTTVAAFVDWALAHDFAPHSTAEVTLRGARYRLTLHLVPCLPPAAPADPAAAHSPALSISRV